jgi:hypothetical protein
MSGKANVPAQETNDEGLLNEGIAPKYYQHVV